MPGSWYIARDGQQHGPLTAEEFAEFVRRGALRPTDFLWHEGAKDWFPATQYVPPTGAEPVVTSNRHSVNDGAKQTETGGKKITDEEYRTIVEGARTGALLIGIDRAVARRFLMEVPLARIEAMTGEKPYVEKLVAMSLFAGTWACLLASLPLAYLAFGWWAAAVIPISGLVYFAFMSSGSLGGSGLKVVTLLVVVASVATYLEIFPNPHMGWYAIAFSGSVWTARAIYTTTTALVRAFVLRNKRAFETLNPRVVPAGEL